MVRPHRKKITAKTTKIAAHVTLKELSDRDFNVFSKSNSFYPYLNTLNLTRRLGENIAPLGTITYLRNHAKNKYRFDKKFLSRLDYKLWYTLTKHEGRFYTDGVLSIIEEGLKHENTTITWGVLSCLSALRSNQEVMLNKHKLLELLKIAEKRLDNISPITDLEADCFLVFIRFKSYKQRFVYNTLSERHPFTLLAELFENACHALRQIDLKWELGSDLSLESFKIARDKGLSLIPWHYHDFSSNIAYILCQLSFALIFSLEYIDKKNQDLLDISTNLMRSAWLLQRSHRIRESTLTRKSKQDLDKIKYNEFQALNFYIQTLRSAGNFNLANIHAWYFLVTLPPNFEKTSDFEFVPTNMAGNVRQAGLTVDSRRYPQLKKIRGLTNIN